VLICAPPCRIRARVRWMVLAGRGAQINPIWANDRVPLLRTRSCSYRVLSVRQRPRGLWQSVMERANRLGGEWAWSRPLGIGCASLLGPVALWFWLGVRLLVGDEG